MVPAPAGAPVGLSPGVRLPPQPGGRAALLTGPEVPARHKKAVAGNGGGYERCLRPEIGKPVLDYAAPLTKGGQTGCFSGHERADGATPGT